MNVVIIGAGPVGCYVGYLLARGGLKVTIYENHAKIGVPIQCTGLLTHDFDMLGIPKDAFLVNTLTRIDVFSPHAQAHIPQKEYLVCRTKFDNYFADLAQEAGATILVSHSFDRKEGDQLIISRSVEGDEISVRADIVIAADGPLSPTAKAYGFFDLERINYYGVQAVVAGVFDSHALQAYFGVKVCPGLFVWVVPESTSQARVGLACMKDSRLYFEQFMKEKSFTAVEMQAGIIPIYSPRQKLVLGNCYVVGDAAGFVKATTLGGLIPGLRQAQILASCLLEGGDYEQKVKGLRRELKMHLRMHQMFEKFTDLDWDRLVGYIGQKRIQNILSQHTRENPFPILVKSLLREPRFMYFAKFLR